MTQKVKALLAQNEIYIYGPIGEWGVSAKAFIDALKSLNTKNTVNVRINSEGGDVAHALAMYNALNELSDVVVHIDGLAASAASVVAMAGKTLMAENALMMMHRPWSQSVGDADAMRKAGEILDKFQPTLISAYSRKTGIDDEKLNEMLAAETWLTAAEALELGFVDEVVEPMAIAASTDLSIFDHVPERIQQVHNQVQTNYREIKELVETHNQFRSDNSLKAEDLIAKGMTTPESVRTHILNELGKDVTPTAGVIQVDHNDQIKDFVSNASDAILARHGLVQSKDIDDKARNLAGMSILSMADRFVNLHGISTSLMSPRQILDRAFAMHSTSDFSHLLGNTAGKALRAGYMEEVGSHEVWTGQTTVRDFKPQTLVQLSEAPDLKHKPEGSEYTYGSFSDDAMSFQIKTYGKMFALTREAMINDDLDAFTRLPRAFGMSAKRLEADKVYEILTGNPTMNDGNALFSAAHANQTGAYTDLTVEALAEARKLMRLQKGMKSTAPINLTPVYLIVPAELETDAEQLLSSLVDPSKQNDTANPAFVRGLTLVVDSRLDAIGNDCYVAANPTQVDTITRAYLEGEGRPHFEQREGWTIDAMEVKARLDFAAVPVDYRGLVKLQIS